MSNHEYINDIIASFSGSRRQITFPKIYLELTGEYHLAVFLNQLIYWSDKSHRNDGYFYKKNDDWKEEILLSDYQIRRATKKLKEMGFIETALKKANGTPTTHYKVHTNTISDAIIKFLKNGKLKNSTMESEVIQDSLECEETSDSLTIDYNNGLQQLSTDTYTGLGSAETKNQNKIPYQEVIEYLNDKAGKNFSYKAKRTREQIKARFNEGHTLDDFKHVIDIKVLDWSDDTAMRTYLKPETLFNSRNFDNYKNETEEEVKARREHWNKKQQTKQSSSNDWLMKEIGGL